MKYIKLFSLIFGFLILLSYYCIGECIGEKCMLKNEISARVQKTFDITVSSNPSTGFEWKLGKPLDEKLVKLVGSKYIPKKTKLIGAGGTEVWTFKALKSGKTEIMLIYLRSWEKLPPAKSEAYKIIIKK